MLTVVKGSGYSIYYFFGDINQDLCARSTRATRPTPGRAPKPFSLARLTWPGRVPGDLGELNELQQRVAPALVGRTGVELPEALVGRVEHGGEDHLFQRELGVVGLVGLARPVGRAGLA